MVKVALTLKARRDLEAIGEYIALDNPARAESFKKELLLYGIESISSFPLAYPLCNKAKNIRRLVYGDYNIYYQFDADKKTAFILHVLNSALLLNSVLKKL